MSIRERKLHFDYELQPTKKLCTEGDILIKRLSSKQTQKHVELTTDLAENNRFVSRSHFEPITNCREGTCSVAELKDQCKDLEQLEKFKSAGLSNSDIKFYIDYKLNRMERFKNVEDTVLLDKLNRIELQIKTYEDSNDNFSQVERVRPNILLLEKPNSMETRLLKFSLNNEKPKENVTHPMDNIKTIESALFSHLPERINIKSIRNKTRKVNNRISKLDTHESPMNLKIDRKTNWDVVNPIPDRNVNDANKIYSCKAKAPNHYTVRNGEIIKLNNINRSPVQVSEEKISLDEIRKLPKFSTYQIGKPCKIVYVQNLANAITENDLKSIFKLYETNITSYKLLTGRLKGRAFITFDDEISCAAAFHKLNGSFLRNKPMIFEYGKK